jgi:glycosyltransferase involved in cell wall biosynthesis
MKICILHRYPPNQIKATNAAFPYLAFRPNVEIKTFRTFNRLNDKQKLLKSILWIFYAPFLVIGRGYDVIYCDDSFPFYPMFVKLASPHSRIILRLGDLHLMYYCSGILYKVLHFIEKISWRLAYKIFAISPTMAEYIYKEIHRPVETIFDPIDSQDFIPRQPRINNEKTTVMFHGLLIRNKNVDILLEAAKQLPDVNFIIIGDGPDYQRLKSLAPKNVAMNGWLPFNLISIAIDKCDIGVALRTTNPGNEFVVTSPFLQYSIMAKPCIVSHRQVFDDIGYIWQYKTVGDLVRFIQILSDKQLAHDEGQTMRKYILAKHDAKKIGDEIWSRLLS